MKKQDVVNKLLPKNSSIQKKIVSAYAPTNIALCKYWGKRNTELNLPFNSSISISLGNKGATTKISLIDEKEDQIVLNEKELVKTNSFAKKIIEFIDLFRADQKINFCIETNINIPVAAGLASSACGFAALVKALNELMNWNLDKQELSILARLGSGSASRSLWDGFVEWQRGEQADGMDSYAFLLAEQWPELRIGLLILSDQEKNISSRDAMQQTVTTSSFYSCWLEKVNKDLKEIKHALAKHDFNLFGEIAESNALAMHATMQTTLPAINYCMPETMAAMQKIWRLRQAGLDLYFTQDAGPNLKLLFLKKDNAIVQKQFPDMEILAPFV